MIYTGGVWQYLVVMSEEEKITDYISECESIGLKMSIMSDGGHCALFKHGDDMSWWGGPGYEDSVGITITGHSMYWHHDTVDTKIRDGTLVPIYIEDIVEVE